MNTFPHATPESVGISSKSLLALMKRLDSLEHLNSLVILRHGKVVLECWKAPYERETPHQLFSLSKSFVSIAVGLAQESGLLKLSDKLVSFFPEYKECITDARMNQVTLLDLLTMRSGHLRCSTLYFKGCNDFVRAFLSSPLDTEPGAQFCYNSGASYMLASVIRRVTGENVREYLLPRLFEPLKIAPGQWESCYRGTNLGGWGLYLTTDDLAKVGQLFLQHGKWNGVQLIPEDYLRFATSKIADNSQNSEPDWKVGYGLHFWRSRHGYRGDGASGQYIVVLEEEDMAIAVTSCMSNMGNVLSAFWEELLPGLADNALPEDPESLNALRSYTDAMAIPVTPGDWERTHANCTFTFAPNDMQLERCEVAFGEKVCTLTFHCGNRVEQLRAGFGFYQTSVLQLNDYFVHPVAASAAWKNDHVLEINTLITDGIYRDCWTIDFADPQEPLKNVSQCGCFRPEKPRFFLNKLSK